MYFVCWLASLPLIIVGEGRSGDLCVKQLSRMIFVYHDGNRREVGRSETEQDVLGTPEGVGR
jgi:hypothetical protein